MSNRATSTRAGLFVPTDRGQVPVPLVGVTVDAEVHGFCAKVVVSHRYVNREDQPIEAVYLFPLDESSAVCGFEAIVDGSESSLRPGLTADAISSMAAPARATPRLFIPPAPRS